MKDTHNARAQLDIPRRSSDIRNIEHLPRLFSRLWWTVNLISLHAFFSKFSVSLPGYQGNLQAALSHTHTIGTWERLGVEMVLTFVVVFTYFVSTNTHRKIFGNAAMMIGAAYSACNFVSVSWNVSQNRRILWSSFVYARRSEGEIESCCKK